HREERRFLRLDVEELGPGPLFGLPHGDALGRDRARDLRPRIVEVAGEDRVNGTDDDAGRLQADVRPVRAEVALGGGAGFRIDVDRVVRARLEAGLAADAGVRIELDDAVGPLEHRRGRADRDARRLRAVVAAGDLEVAPRVRKDPLLDVLDPRA